MGKAGQLRDGTEVMMRPASMDDVDRYLGFFRGMPPEDREYLRVDVTRRDVVQKRLVRMESGRIERIAAVVDDRIVADGAFEQSDEDWTAHVGELRLVVAREYQRKGLGTLMARELYLLAAARNVERIVVTMARPQVGAKRIFHKLGFREEAALPGHVKGRSGSKHDLILMSCDLETLWQEMEAIFRDSDRRPEQ